MLPKLVVLVAELILLVDHSVSLKLSPVQKIPQKFDLQSEAKSSSSALHNAVALRDSAFAQISADIKKTSVSEENLQNIDMNRELLNNQQQLHTMVAEEVMESTEIKVLLSTIKRYLSYVLF